MEYSPTEKTQLTQLYCNSQHNMCSNIDVTLELNRSRPLTFSLLSRQHAPIFIS